MSVYINLKLTDLVKIVMCVRGSVPVIALHTTPGAGRRIRCLLGMNDKNGLVYDPCSAGKFEYHFLRLYILDITGSVVRI